MVESIAGWESDSPAPDERAWRWIAWNAIERGGALLLALVCAPVVASLALAVILVSRKSPFVAHRRAGWRGRDLWMIKIRTLWEHASPANSSGFLVERVAEAWVPPDKSSGDPRVRHPFARWLRQYSLDELPQLLHVIRGQMALTGPRPVTWREMRAYYGRDAAEVLSVRPGITGLWQVLGRNQLSYQQRRRLDLFLARNRSISLRLWIIARTIPAVIGGKCAG